MSPPTNTTVQFTGRDVSGNFSFSLSPPPAEDPSYSLRDREAYAERIGGHSCVASPSSLLPFSLYFFPFTSTLLFASCGTLSHSLLHSSYRFIPSPFLLRDTNPSPLPLSWPRRQHNGNGYGNGNAGSGADGSGRGGRSMRIQSSTVRGARIAEDERNEDPKQKASSYRSNFG
ncbi:hypothetical protein MSAN_02054800 [Mycena sanguinolenta]|uniref:Uncharacterized protein n=1 Tax=Mycena sanguinolenta TaxID=230812 RepID=A0A8H7CNB2_9AGAR|nr:hypothetical protein MSAN_02054800 [Mycena sanguinolenta]